MKLNKISISNLLLSILTLTALQAQESINTTGGNASGSGGSASYSIGQTVYQTSTGTNGSIAEGVQQPYEISDVTAIENTENIQPDVSVFPNPTTESVCLQIANHELSSFSFQLFDAKAQLIESREIQSDITQIDMSVLATATYFLKVLEGNNEVKIFKIIKNK